MAIDVEQNLVELKAMSTIDILIPTEFMMWVILLILTYFILNALHSNNQFWYETIFVKPVHGLYRVERKPFRGIKYTVVTLLFSVELSVSLTVDRFDIAIPGMVIGIFLFMGFSYAVIISGYRKRFEHCDDEAEL
jgi:hypothetical protein